MSSMHEGRDKWPYWCKMHHKRLESEKAKRLATIAWRRPKIAAMAKDRVPFIIP